MNRRVAIGAAVLVGVIAGPILAGFGASDLIYIPVVSHTPGAVGSNWATDLYITNVDEVAIDVAIAYLPSGGINNSPVFTDRTTWLGGREDDSFGLLNEELADIPPNGTVVLRDIVGEYWVSILGQNGLGALVVTAYEADTLEPDGSRVIRNAIVNARIYDETTVWVPVPDTEDEFTEEPAEYGQAMPGVPWYNLADGGAVGETFDFSFEELTGGEEHSERRYNVGVVNASDPLTSITVRIQPYQANGEPFLNDEESEIFSLINLAPAAHIQLFRPFRNDWNLEDVEGATVRVSILGWSSNAAVPIVMMSSYGSVVQNKTNDPSTVLPSFAYPYDVECMWGGGGGGGGAKRGTPTRRPIEIPAQR